MLNFRGGFGFDLVDSGWFQALRVGDDSLLTRFDINYFDTNFPYGGQIPDYFDTISTWPCRISGSCTLHVITAALPQHTRVPMGRLALYAT